MDIEEGEVKGNGYDQKGKQKKQRYPWTAALSATNFTIPDRPGLVKKIQKFFAQHNISLVRTQGKGIIHKLDGGEQGKIRMEERERGDERGRKRGSREYIQPSY